MADMDSNEAMYTTIKSVPSWMVDNAISWHNQVSGLDWNRTYEKHPDIQHRIGLLIDSCDEYVVRNGKVVYIGD